MTKKAKSTSSLDRLRRALLPLITIAGVIILGVMFLLVSHAATSNSSITPAAGVVSGNASIVSNSSAYNGKAVKFNAAVNRTAPCGWGATQRPYKHVIWIWMENRDYSNIVGSSSAPYINTLINQCALATNLVDTSTEGSLPSEPEYAAATSGSNCNTGNDRTGSNCIENDNDYGPNNSLTTTSIFQLVKNSGGTWKSYQEGMPSNCARTSSSPYAYKHNPAAFYSSMSADCANFDIPIPSITCNGSSVATCTPPSGAFYNDIKSGTLPTFSFVTPNLNNDMHDGSIIENDNWLRTYLPVVFSGPNYQSGNTAVFLMWDESASGNNTSLIPNVIIAPSIKPGSKTGVSLNDVGILHTTEAMLGISPYLGCASGTPPGNVGSCLPGGASSTVDLRSYLNL